MKSKVFFISFNKDDSENVIAEKSKRVFSESGILNNIEKKDIVGIKLHFGEKGGKNFLRPLWVKSVADELAKRADKICLTDTNTLYIGSRSNTISHTKIASNHGFNIENTGYPVVISDGIIGRNFELVDIGKKHFSHVKIASDIIHMDFLLSMAHMTGHFQTGFGASIKNTGMGCASRAGKLEQHSKVLPDVTNALCTGCGTCLKWCPADAIEIVEKKAVIKKNKCIGCGECTVMCKFGAIEIKWNETVKNLQEKMAEYALGVHKSKDKKIGYMNFLQKMTKNCDCMAKDEPYIMRDIGILASDDPVAIDKASVDLMNKIFGSDLFKSIYPNVDYNIQLNYGFEIGLGNIDYELIEIK